MIAGCSADRGLSQMQPQLPFDVAERYFVKNNVSVVPVVLKTRPLLRKSLEWPPSWVKTVCSHQLILRKAL